MTIQQIVALLWTSSKKRLQLSQGQSETTDPRESLSGIKLSRMKVQAGQAIEHASAVSPLWLDCCSLSEPDWYTDHMLSSTAGALACFHDTRPCIRVLVVKRNRHAQNMLACENAVAPVCCQLAVEQMVADDSPAVEEVQLQGQGPGQGQLQCGAGHWTSCEPWGHNVAGESPGQSTAGSVPAEGHRSEGQARQPKGPGRQTPKGELAL